MHKSSRPFIVGITGYATSGKDTFAAGLVNVLGFKKLAFAGPLRRDIAALDPIVAVLAHNQFVRASDCFKDYNASKKKYPEFRRLLQVYGTEVHRALDENYWVNRAKELIVADGTPGYVFTDVRFPNERTGIDFDMMVRVNRPGVVALNDHESEAHIATMEVDFEVQNDGTETELAVAAVDLARKFLDIPE